MKSLGLSCLEEQGSESLGWGERESKMHPEGSTRTVLVVLRLSGVEDRSQTTQVLTGDFVAEAVCPDQSEAH